MKTILVFSLRVRHRHSLLITNSFVLKENVLVQTSYSSIDVPVQLELGIHLRIYLIQTQSNRLIPTT